MTKSYLPFGSEGGPHDTSKVEELDAITVGACTPSGILSSVLALLCGLVVQPPPVQACIHRTEKNEKVVKGTSLSGETKQKTFHKCLQQKFCLKLVFHQSLNFFS